MKYDSNSPYMKKIRRRWMTAEALRRQDNYEPALPGDAALLSEESRRYANLVTVRHWREERKYAKLPREQRIRFDVQRAEFYRECNDGVAQEDGTQRREWHRNYIVFSSSHAQTRAWQQPEYQHAITQAIHEAETAETELQTIKDSLEQEPVMDAAREYLAAIGRRGGLARSEKKTAAARQNAKRPRKPRIPRK